MHTKYELWDLESGNQIKSFDSEAEALALVGKLIELNGPDYLNDLALGATLLDAEVGTAPPPTLEGRELLERVREVCPVNGPVGEGSSGAVAGGSRAGRTVIGGTTGSAAEVRGNMQGSVESQESRTSRPTQPGIGDQGQALLSAGLMAPPTQAGAR